MKNCQFFLSSGLVSFFKSINFISRFDGQTSGIKFRFFSFFPNFSLAIRLRVGIDDPSVWRKMADRQKSHNQVDSFLRRKNRIIVAGIECFSLSLFLSFVETLLESKGPAEFLKAPLFGPGFPADRVPSTLRSTLIFFVDRLVG